MTLRNWNRSPWDGEYNPVTITDEPYTVGYDTALAQYGIRLNSAPLRTESSGNMTIKRVSDSSELTEVSRTIAPSAGEYRVDYEADTYLGTGWIQMNASDNGLQVLASYQASGDVIKGGVIAETAADNTFTGDNTFIGSDTFSQINATSIYSNEYTGTFAGNLTYWADPSPNTAGAKTLPSTGTWMVFMVASLSSGSSVSIDSFVFLNNQSSGIVNCASFLVITGSSFTIAKSGFPVIEQTYAIRLSPNT